MDNHGDSEPRLANWKNRSSGIGVDTAAIVCAAGGAAKGLDALRSPQPRVWIDPGPDPYLEFLEKEEFLPRALSRTTSKPKQIDHFSTKKINSGPTIFFCYGQRKKITKNHGKWGTPGRFSCVPGPYTPEGAREHNFDEKNRKNFEVFFLKKVANKKLYTIFCARIG